MGQPLIINTRNTAKGMLHDRMLKLHIPSLPQRPYVCRDCLRRIGQYQASDVPVSRSWTRIRGLQTSTSAPEVVPFRKQLKDEAKRKRSQGQPKSSKTIKQADPKLERWELTVGIEIHAELNTARKLFSSAATSINDAPNTHVALFDAAFPGTQPQFQRETLIPALRAAIALHCDIQRRSSFDRKHYFYQDQPAGYQITQYYEPFAKDGHIVLYDHDGIAPEDGKEITVGIKQIQMEQDTAKTLLQPPSMHLLDFNRVSHPLIEIITLPHIHHPTTAAACVRKIQAILKSVNAVTAGMEMGGLRADVNVSIRERHRGSGSGAGRSYYGVTGLGQRTEIKNLSSIKAVEDAIIAERDRQIEVLEAGGVIEGETRGWTLGSTQTRKLRGKEGEIDYRYMPDPDLSAVLIGEDLIQHLHDGLPMLPDRTTNMLVNDSKYDLTIKDAKTLASLDDGDRLEYYLDVVALLEQQLSSEELSASKAGKMAANWVLHELGGLYAAVEESWSSEKVPAIELASILAHLLRRQITGRTAKQLLSMIFAGDARSAEQIIDDESLLLRPMSREEYISLAQDVLQANPTTVKAITEKGQTGKIMWFVGQMMRTGEEGRVEAQRAEGVLKELLKLSQSG